MQANHRKVLKDVVLTLRCMEARELIDEVILQKRS